MLYESRWMMKKRDFVEKCLMTDESTDWTFTACENYSTSDWRFSACCGIIFDQLKKRAVAQQQKAFSHRLSITVAEIKVLILAADINSPFAAPS